MAYKPVKLADGMTLVEVLIATIIVAVAAIGILSYEYHAARQTEMARAHVEAVRIGHFLLEDWKANGASPLYIRGMSGVSNPEDLGMGFGYREAGVYEVTVNSIPMLVHLSRDPPDSYSKLIEITAKVQWRGDFAVGYDIGIDDPGVVLMTHARVDQEGG